MDFKEFKESALKDIIQTLNEEGLEFEYKETHVNKLQGQSYQGIQFNRKGSNAAMVADFRPFFCRYDHGEKYSVVLEDLLEYVHKWMDNAPDCENYELEEYESIKKYLMVELVPRADNQKLLLDIPYQNVEDMAAVYRIVLPDREFGGVNSVLIDHSLLDQYGVDVMQLHKDAVRNMETNHPYRLDHISRLIKEMSENTGIYVPEEYISHTDYPMFVASNDLQIFGASVILYHDMLRETAEKVGLNLFILPSSIHEVIVLGDKGTYTPEELIEMVSTINREVVLPEERLTDNVYYYNRETDTFGSVTQLCLDKSSNVNAEVGEENVAYKIVFNDAEYTYVN